MLLQYFHLDRYTGWLNDLLIGFYRSSYKDENGDDTYLGGK